MIIQWSREFVYYLGFLWADGSINRNGIRLEIVEEDLLLILEDLLKINFIKFNTYSRERIGYKPTMQIYFCNVKFYDMFFSIYFENKSNSSPSKLLDIIPDDLTRYFFNGLIDGDGSFYISDNLKTKQFSISSSYDQDWSYLMDLFSKLSVMKYEIVKRVHKKSKSSVVRCSNYNDIFKIYQYLYPNGFEIGLNRKYEKCKLIIDNKPNHTSNNSIITESELVQKIEEFKNIDIVCDYFECSRRKIFNYCRKFKINKEGFCQDVRLKKQDYLTIEQSTKYMRELGLKSKKEWLDFCKNGLRPSNIPSNPFSFYNDWISYGDWLGFDIKNE